MTTSQHQKRQQRRRLIAELPDDLSDYAWGVRGIAKAINAKTRRTAYLIEKGALPVKRLGPRTIVASKSQLRAALIAETADID